jgi:2-octaprenyl-6-methoxyphenol hydroxylase
MATEYDVIIVGGGMVGASLAIALAGTSSKLAIIEASTPKSGPQPSYDDRGLALTLSSQRVLNGLGLWEQISATSNPVTHVHVSDQHHFGFVRLHAELLHLTALGYVITARELGHILLEKIGLAENIDLVCPVTVTGVENKKDSVNVTVNRDGNIISLTGNLLVAADGSNSNICKLLGIDSVVKDYNQTAIVSNITSGKAHNNTAYERFTSHGPLAILPLSGRHCAIVFTVATADTQLFMEMHDDDFLGQLQSCFGRRLGTFQKLGSRKSYPIQLITAKEQIRERVVVLGNAAHTIHPNAAQGFNLCLRDIAGLAEILLPALRNGSDPGQQQLLNKYCDLREKDQHKVIQFTDSIVSMFYNELPHKVMLRNFGMLLIDLCPMLKQSFVRRTTGLYGHQPALVRGLTL